MLRISSKGFSLQFLTQALYIQILQTSFSNFKIQTKESITLAKVLNKKSL